MDKFVANRYDVFFIDMRVGGIAKVQSVTDQRTYLGKISLSVLARTSVNHPSPYFF